MTDQIRERDNLGPQITATLRAVAEQTVVPDRWDKLERRLEHKPLEDPVIRVRKNSHLFAAAAVFIAAVGGLYFLSTRGTTPVSTVSVVTAVEGTTTVTDEVDELSAAVALGGDFIRAVDDWDAPATVALLDPDAEISDLIESIELYGSKHEWLEILNWRWTLDECTVTHDVPPIRVVCFYTHHNAWMDALGDDPVRNRYVFTITDGRITKVDNLFFAFRGWSEFHFWVDANHPNDLDVMFDSNRSVPLFTPESLALWERNTAEFVAEFGSGN